MNSEMDLLFMKPFGYSEILCVNKSDRKLVFKSPAYKDGFHSHHWVILNKRHYLSVQSAKNVVKFFSVEENGKQFTENESLRITLPDSDSITYVEFDKKFENVFLVKNGDELEQRRVSGDQGVVMTMKLEQKVSATTIKRMSLSDDGKWCAIGGGRSKPFWFLVDVEKG